MKPYKMPEGYLSWNKFEKELNVIVNSDRILTNLGIHSPIIEVISQDFQFWYEGDYPLYCVKNEFLEDMLQTDVSEKLALFKQIMLPIPCFILFFPKNKVKSPSEKEAYIDYLIIRHQELVGREHKYVVSWACLDSKLQAIAGYRGIREDGTLKRSAFSTEDPKQQKASLDLRNLALQSILLLQHYPGFFTENYIPVEITNFKGFSNQQHNNIQTKLKNEFRFPRWLGEKKEYKRKHISSEAGSGSKRKSPHPHVRVGHWRLIDENRPPIWVRKAEVGIKSKSETKIKGSIPTL